LRRSPGHNVKPCASVSANSLIMPPVTSQHDQEYEWKRLQIKKKSWVFQASPQALWSRDKPCCPLSEFLMSFLGMTIIIVLSHYFLG
jgi:hypothetical protein